MTPSLQTRNVSTISRPSPQTAEPANTPPIVPHVSNDNAPAPTVQAPGSPTIAQPFTFMQELANKYNLITLGQALARIADRLGPDASPAAVLSALQNTPMAIHPDSADFADLGANATLESFINHLGVLMPYNHFSLGGLSDSVITRSQEHPLGNLGGALSWPQPPTADEQRRLRLIAMNYAEPTGDKPLVGQTKGLLLEFLRQRTSLPPGDLGDPVAALNALISSPEAQQMGKALQERMQGVDTDKSATDYLLAAMALQLDPESITAPKRNSIAGFDLTSDKHWGKPASVVIDALSKHLVEKGKTSPDLAKAGTHLLLAARAPVFLIKDIPNSVTYGSPAWVNLTVAAATIEAKTPGRVPNMTFAQVMLEAEGASLENPAVTEEAQRSALIDWGVANGVLEKKDDHQYSADKLNTLVTTFKTRQSSMAQAAQAFEKDIPSRKEMALAELKRRFPGKESMFEKRVITALPHGAITEFGPHSLLDVTMMYADTKSTYTSTAPRVPVAQLNEHPGFGVFAAFQSQFKNTIEEKKAAVSTSIKHLISQLPLQDRENFEYGKVSFYQTHSQKLGTGFGDKTQLPKNPKLLVRIERDGVPTAYEIDFNGGAIRKVPASNATTGTWRTANIEYEKKAFTPSVNATNLSTEQSVPNAPRLDSFASTRTQLIADAFVEHINLDDPAIHELALGQTTGDKHRKAADTVGRFMLDLIPFVSTVKNFSQGKITEGIFNLGLDIFGFLTAGVGTAGKLTKIAGSAVSTATKVARATKVIGAVVFGQLNPVDGVIDVIWGGAKFIGKGAKKCAEGINVLRGASGNYDLLKAASKQFDAAAIGTTQSVAHNTDAAAVLKEGKWYNFDVANARPYGAPLTDFRPATLAAGGEIKASNPLDAGNWLTSLFSSAPVSSTQLRRDFEATRSELLKADSAGFNRGYDRATPPTIDGYSARLSISEIHELSLKATRTAEEVGSLVRRIEDLEELPNKFFTKAKNLQLNDAEAFNNAYQKGVPDSVSGYSPTLKIAELQELALQPGRSTADIGVLFRQIERKTVAFNLELSRKFGVEVQAAGGTVVHIPQGFYLSQVQPISQGQCAALAQLMAYAKQEGRATTLIDNLGAAMAYPDHPSTKAFRDRLQSFHSSLRTNFHGAQATRDLGVTQIISDLSSAQTSKSVLISNEKHAISAGVTVTVREETINGVKRNVTDKTWFYYDPNLGLATFPNENAMRDGVTRAMSSGSTSALFQPHPDTLTYKVSDFNELGLMNTVGDIQGPYNLFARPIVIPRPQLQSAARG